MFLSKSGKRVRLAKKTPCPPVSGVHRGSVQPVPSMEFHDPVVDGDPGAGRRVARMICVDSSPGDRLDRAGIRADEFSLWEGAALPRLQEFAVLK